MIFKPKKLPLSKFERIISEENGHADEGILEYLRETLPDKSNFFVEFGAGNGLDWLNGRRLIEDHNYGALLIECDEKLGTELVKRYSEDPKIRASTEFIRKDNIESIFKSHEVPTGLDFLIIDIDSNDYHIWKSIENYHPKVVCIEYNASYPPGKEFIAEYDPQFVWQQDDYFGASIESYNKLANSKGYSLIHCTSNGENLYFIRNEYLSLIDVENTSPEFMYQLPTMGKFGRAANGKGHPASVRNTTSTQRQLLKLRYYLTSILRHIV